MRVGVLGIDGDGFLEVRLDAVPLVLRDVLHRPQVPAESARHEPLLSGHFVDDLGGGGVSRAGAVGVAERFLGPADDQERQTVLGIELDGLLRARNRSRVVRLPEFDIGETRARDLVPGIESDGLLELLAGGGDPPLLE